MTDPKSTEKIVITLFAKDRPGIVQALSDIVLVHHGNWLESSLSRLCGQFTGIVLIQIAPDDKQGLLADFAALNDSGIQVTVQQATDVTSDDEDVEGLQIMVEANDRPGIVEEITKALANAQVNVDHMDTEVESASMAGYPLFRAHLFLALPDGMSMESLEAVLENVSDDVMVSVLDE